MRFLRVLAAVLAVVLLLGAGWWGLRRYQTRAQGTPQAVEVADATLPAAVDGAAVVGLGEATHGTREFWTARQVLTEKLITEHGYTAVAIEGDFGGGRVVDAYLRTGQGTAEQAAAALGFRIYRNEDVVAFLTMLREHNAALPPERQVAFYGIDFQRFDRNKEQLEAYLRPVDPDLADRVAAATAPLDDDVVPVDKAVVAETLPELQAALDTFTADRENLTAATDPDGYALAGQNLRVIIQMLEMSETDALGRQVRDEQLAENVTWVVDRESAAGRGGVVLLAHNSHVSRVPTGGGGAVWSGTILAEQYGRRYVAIGTDLRAGTFSAGETDGSITMRQPYRGIFDGTRIGYVDLRTLAPENRRLMEQQTAMAAVGAAWAGWMGLVPFSHSYTVAPAQAYDALVYVQQSTPTVPRDW